ncbi:MAG: PG0541 family transporter-associated protein [Kiritimatiellia bacterium]
MKALWITYDIALDNDIVALMDEFNIAGFTRWPRLSGRGPNSGARLDNHVWPGANAAVITVQNDETIARLMVRLQALRNEVGKKTGVWAFTTPVLETLK